jgi:hypothetical protein
MDDKNYVPVRERQQDAFEKRLDKALKQYSVVKVGNANGAIHGKDYREMFKIIMNTFFEKD